MTSPLGIGNEFVENLFREDLEIENIRSLYLYGSGSVNQFVPGKSDIDLWMIIRVHKGHYDMDFVRRLYDAHKGFVSNLGERVDLIIYGEDELPQKNSIGYSLLQSLFILDYKKSAILLLGSDILRFIPEIDQKYASIVLANHMKRGLRQRLSNAGYLSSSAVVRRLIGDRNEGTVYVTEDVSADINSIENFAEYSAIMAAKCRLAYAGILKVGKEEIVEEYTKKFSDEKQTEVMKDILRRRQGIPIGSDFAHSCLDFVEYVSHSLENVFGQERASYEPA
ncbi:MAG: hypothetical protein HYX24_03110 [Candidatus Aenigmarchaeota archaeon]|nr:hypothetical protein [Candidatus Aenigmarchaeota archaeon]